MIKRVFYACGGAANIVGAHEAWLTKAQDASEVSITFSSQVADYCKEIGASAYFVSPHPDARFVQHDEFTLEHRPRNSGTGLRFHLKEMLYGWRLFRSARKYGADIAFLDTGSMPPFAMLLFRLAGIPAVTILHNSLWAAHSPPTGLKANLVRALDRLYWRHGASGAVCVSPECERQVRIEAPKLTYPIEQVRAQFHRQHFANVPPPPAHDARPFRVMFVGRMNEGKGIFDILEMARLLEASDPGMVRWTIRGHGEGYEPLLQRHAEMGLGDVVEIGGWISPAEQLELFARSHAAIVPTRRVVEALAMTAVEAAMAGRPVILNPAVPAVDLMREACMVAETNDAASHAGKVKELASDPALYAQLRAACAACVEPFYDREQGLTAGLRRVVKRMGLN